MIAACWTSRTVLGGALGATGIALVVLTLARVASGTAGSYSIAIAALALLIGTILYVLGQALERLLDASTVSAECCKRSAARWMSQRARYVNGR